MLCRYYLHLHHCVIARREFMELLHREEQQNNSNNRVIESNDDPNQTNDVRTLDTPPPLEEHVQSSRRHTEPILTRGTQNRFDRAQSYPNYRTLKCADDTLNNQQQSPPNFQSPPSSPVSHFSSVYTSDTIPGDSVVPSSSASTISDYLEHGEEIEDGQKTPTMNDYVPGLNALNKDPITSHEGHYS